MVRPRASAPAIALWDKIAIRQAVRSSETGGTALGDESFPIPRTQRLGECAARNAVGALAHLHLGFASPCLHRDLLRTDQC
jgi:hypothetical protein